MHRTLQDYGSDKLIAAFNSDMPLWPVLHKAVQQASAGEPQPFAGMIGAATGILSKAVALGYRFRDDGAILNEDAAEIQIHTRTLWNTRDGEGLNRTLTILCNALELLRESLPEGSRISKNSPTPAPLPVQVISTAPSEVRVVGMPDRQTTSTITRDDEGNIVSTTQLERDRLGAVLR